MYDRRVVRVTLLLAAALIMPVASYPQTFTGSLSGIVKDQSGASVVNAEMVLKNVATGVETRRSSEADGGYAFRNVVPGNYELRVTFAGFQPYRRAGIEVLMRADVRLDVTLAVGGQTETVEVAAASALNHESGAKEDGIAPQTLEQLPLMFGSGPRVSASFVILMPGVTTGGSNSPYDARINGGMQTGDEAVLDGASMQQGYLSQSGMVSIGQDFPFSPDMVSEVNVVSSSYEPQYGASTSGQVIADFARA